jgi:dihydrofolate synthase/folylpolyglutamate synthase
MTYKEALTKIHSLDAFGSRPGLDRIKRLLNEMGNPQDNMSYVHVAGTNGKGSTCALISSVLTEANYKTGLFISPYITDFRERIQINGEMISEEVLADAVDKTYPLLLKLREDDCIITEFEYVMALEFYIHNNAHCDVVVLETGMGGLLDCTNVILPPLCSVITTIGLDHTAILGDTIEKIAEQKCGIIKSGSPVVTSAQEEKAMAVIENTAQAKNVPLIKSDDVNISQVEQTLQGTTFIYNGKKLSLPLVGTHQIENAKTALAVIEILKNHFNISDDSLQKGFEKAVNPARFEIMSKEPLIILDGAHNPNGIEALKSSLVKHLEKHQGICIMGMLADKDSKSSVKLLEGIFSKVFTVPVNNPRSLSASALAEECTEYFSDVTACDSPFKAFDMAYSLAKETNEPLIICGSLYLAGEIRPYIIDKI